jgi:hypothetical protein
MQDLVSGEVKQLPSTAGAESPAFAPDGSAIGFVNATSIEVLRLDGGLPRDVAPAGPYDHWTWGGPDHIVIAGDSGLQRVSVNGGSPEVVAALLPDEALFSSAFPLPNGAYLVSVRARGATDEASRVVVVKPNSSERLSVAERGGSPIFIGTDGRGSGHVVFADAGRLMAIPFDGVRSAVIGPAVPILENVSMRPNGDRADFAVAAGRLVYREGSLQELVWIDRGTGTVRMASANLRRFALPRLSPDGTRLAMEIQDSPHQIWMLDLERDVLVPLTTDAEGSHNFAWAPDGQSIVYSAGAKLPHLGWIRTDGSRTTHRIAVPGDHRVMVDDWSVDGRLAMLMGAPPKHAVMIMRLEGGSPPRVSGSMVRVTEGFPGSFSPDGAWIAYCDCGVAPQRPTNVFIRHLESGTTHQVSTQGGTEPVWAASGREVFFRAGTKIMVAPVTIDGARARIGRPLTVFEGDYMEWSSPNYDVTADGRQFLMVRTANANTRSLSVRLNWTAELERVVPGQR